MGRSRGLRGAHRLRAIARELEPRRGPWWVCQPGGRTPAQGWWWIPPGGKAPVLLGHNHIVAEVRLRELVDAEYAPRV